MKKEGWSLWIHSKHTAYRKVEEGWHQIWTGNFSSLCVCSTRVSITPSLTRIRRRCPASTYRLYQRMERLLQRKRQQAGQLEMRLKYVSPINRIREKKTYSVQLEDRLQNRMQSVLRDRRHALALYIERMKAVSPGSHFQYH